MRIRLILPAALAVASLGLVGCLEMDAHTVLKADGTGTMAMKIGFTDGFVKVMREMEEIDPDADIAEDAENLFMEAPTEEQKAAMKAAGCDLLEFQGENSETKIFSRFKVAFDRVAALDEIGRLVENEDGSGTSGGGPADGMTLVKNDDGTYTLSMSGEDDDDSDLSEEEIDEIVEEAMDEAEEEVPEDPEEAMKKAARAMELMGALMAEASKLRVEVAMEVPGEIVSFTPAKLGKQDGQKVSWKIDMSAMMSGAMEGGGMDDGFSVTFRMPEGQAIPEAALTTPAAAETPDGE